MIVPARLVQKNPPENAIFTCGCCQTPWRVTEWADMTHGKNFYGHEVEKRDLLYIICPGCKTFTAIPDKSNMAKLIVLYEEWRVLEESLPEKWKTVCYCGECQTASNIMETNLITENGEVKIKCPVCRSCIPSKGIVPSGIISELLIKDLSK